MSLALAAAIIALICAFTSLGFGIRIANELRSRGIQANPLFIRWMIFRYLSVYKRVTLEETGQVGPLYGACSTAATMAALFAIVAIAAKLSS